MTCFYDAACEGVGLGGCFRCVVRAGSHAEAARLAWAEALTLDRALDAAGQALGSPPAGPVVAGRVRVARWGRVPDAHGVCERGSNWAAFAADAGGVRLPADHRIEPDAMARLTGWYRTRDRVFGDSDAGRIGVPIPVGSVVYCGDAYLADPAAGWEGVRFESCCWDQPGHDGDPVFYSGFHPDQLEAAGGTGER